MKDLLKKIGECVDTEVGEGTSASVGAEYPALFLYVGSRAAGNCPEIKKHLKSKLVNAGSILHAVILPRGSEKLPEGADFAITADIPEKRGDTREFITSDDERLTSFNDGIRSCVERLMSSSGFPQTNKCYLFTVTDSDSPVNALLPEFVILFSENAHIRVHTFLFADLSSGSEGFLNSAAFFRELEECGKPDFSYDGAVLMREGQRIPVHHDGAVFDAVFFLEQYRSDMKFSAHNAADNARIEALTAVLEDRDEAAPLPGSLFLTAGISAAHKPASAITHIMYLSLIDMIAGISPHEAAGFPVSAHLGRDAFASVCDRIMLGLPPVSDIVSVLPAADGRDPDLVKNTNIRNILEYYANADERYYTERFEKECERLADCSGGVSISEIFAGYIGKGTLRLSDAVSCLGHDGEVSAYLNDMLDQLSSEEEALSSELDALLAQPAPGLPHGLFAKPTGCDILASAVRAKYGKKTEILRLRVMKRLIGNTLTQASDLCAMMTAALGKIRAFSDALKEEIFGEIYDDGSTLTDTAPFMVHYTDVMRRAVDEYERAGSIMSGLSDRDLYSILMNCGKNGTEELADTALAIFRKLTALPMIREVFAMRFDEELYERYRSYDGGKDRGWVDAQLMRKLTDECRANLRYSVFQPENILCRFGSGKTGFVGKMLEADDAAFGSVFVSDVPCGSYEQLAFYSVPSADSAVYVNECRKVYEKYISENGDSLYIPRNADPKG